MIVVNINSEPFDVYGGRAGNGYDGWLGNPFRVFAGKLTREKSISLYRSYFARRIEQSPGFRKRVLALRGKRVGCFCKPLACHLDVVAEWVNAQEEGVK
jgi:hypothetical protein